MKEISANDLACTCCGEIKPAVVFDYCKMYGSMRYCYECTIFLQIETSFGDQIGICDSCLNKWLKNDVHTTCHICRVKCIRSIKEYPAKKEWRFD